MSGVTFFYAMKMVFVLTEFMAHGEKQSVSKSLLNFFFTNKTKAICEYVTILIAITSNDKQKKVNFIQYVKVRLDSFFISASKHHLQHMRYNEELAVFQDSNDIRRYQVRCGVPKSESTMRLTKSIKTSFFLLHSHFLHSIMEFSKYACLANNQVCSHLPD